MRKNFGAKPLSYPQPVFIIATYGEDGTPDAMNAAWGGISEMNEISMCLSAGHKTVKNILKRRAFTVSMADADHVVASDYVGIVSGNKVTDKFAKAGFHATKSDFVDAPLIDELAVAIECKLKDYDPDTCILRGEIVNVSVDERVLDENGKVNVAKAAPIIFDPFNNDYLRVGEKVGNAFSDGCQQGMIHIIHHAEGAVLESKSLSKPDKYSGKKDHRTGFFDKGPASLPHAAQNISHGRHMVCRQFHNERCRVPGEFPGLF